MKKCNWIIPHLIGLIMVLFISEVKSETVIVKSALDQCFSAELQKAETSSLAFMIGVDCMESLGYTMVKEGENFNWIANTNKAHPKFYQ